MVNPTFQQTRMFPLFSPIHRPSERLLFRHVCMLHVIPLRLENILPGNAFPIPRVGRSQLIYDMMLLPPSAVVLFLTRTFITP